MIFVLKDWLTFLFFIFGILLIITMAHAYMTSKLGLFVTIGILGIIDLALLLIVATLINAGVIF